MDMKLLKREEEQRGVLPVETLNLLYNLLTTILIIIFYNRLQHPQDMLYSHFIIVITTFLLVYLYTRYPSPAIRLIRIVTQMSLLIYWYPETFEFNRIFPNLDHIFAQMEFSIFGCQPAILFEQALSGNIWRELFNLGNWSYYPMLARVCFWYFFKEKKEDKELTQLFQELSDFQFFLVMTSIDKEINQKAKAAFKFFTKESVSFSLEPAQIVVGPLEEKHLITEESFYDFRRILKKMYFIEQENEEIIIRQDDDPRVRNLKIQMKKNREKVAKAKQRQNQGNNNLKFSDLIASVAVGNCGLNIQNIWDITYYAFHDQLKRMGWRDQFNINNRAALAGAKLKKSQLAHWIKSIASEEKS